MGKEDKKDKVDKKEKKEKKDKKEDKKEEKKEDKKKDKKESGKDDDEVKETVPYEDRLKALSPIAAPLANKKLTSKIYKTIKKGNPFLFLFFSSFHRH